jgi:hypothetical protein
VGRQGASKVELGVDAFDTMCGVDILDQSDLEAGGSSLAGGNRRVSEEKLPDL